GEGHVEQDHDGYEGERREAGEVRQDERPADQGVPTAERRPAPGWRRLHGIRRECGCHEGSLGGAAGEQGPALADRPRRAGQPTSLATRSCASLMASSTPVEPDMIAVCMSPRMPWIAAVLADVGFSGRTLCVDHAKVDRSSVGAPSTPKYVSATASVVRAGVIPMAASTCAASSLAANSRNFFAAAALSPSSAALMPKPVGSPKVTGVPSVPVVEASSCGAGAMPHSKASASPVACWAISVAVYQLPIGIMAAFCLPNSPW